MAILEKYKLIYIPQFPKKQTIGMHICIKATQMDMMIDMLHNITR